MSQRRRVAVVGVGVVSSVGSSVDSFWEGLNAPAPVGDRLIDDFDPAPFYESPKHSRRADRSEQMAIASATEAIAGAGEYTADPARAGVVYATGIGGLATFEEQVLVHEHKGSRRVSPFMVPMIMPNASGAAISMRWGLQGPAEVITTACAASTHSIANAARMIATGYADLVVTGGCEAVATPVGTSGFRNMTALSADGTSRPFDVDRNGFVMAEGSATLVLEEMGMALERGATIWGEVLGSGSNADAHHITAPLPGGAGALRCMQLALDDAGLQPGDIRHVNAHGTSTPLNDAAEAEALTKLFGSEPESAPLICSTKGVTGHALGAAGAFEATAVLLAMRHRKVPPTAGHVTPDPDLPQLNLVVGEAADWEPGPAISNSFGFGGHNGCLVLGPPPADAA